MSFKSDSFILLVSLQSMTAAERCFPSIYHLPQILALKVQKILIRLNVWNCSLRQNTTSFLLINNFTGRQALHV